MNTSLVFMPYSFMSPHVDVTLAYAQREIDEGRRVIIMVCRGGNGVVCGFNMYSSKLKCKYCNRRTNDALKSIDGDVEWVDINQLDVDYECLDVIKKIKNSNSLEQVKTIKYHGNDIGYAAVSSLVSRFRTASLNKRKLEILVGLSKAYVRSYNAAIEIIKRCDVNNAFVFNGRFELTRGFFRGCGEQKVNCYVLEVSQVGSKTLSYENALPLDIVYTKKLIDELWDNVNDKGRSMAQDFYEQKAIGRAIHDKVYTGSQKKGLLPNPWNKNRKNVVIFGSSSDEFFAIGPDWEFPFYKNQCEGIRSIAESLSQYSGVDVYYRMHPNLTMLKDNDVAVEFALERKYHNLYVISPEDKISTYALINAADKVVTFGSSVGIEAAYWRKDSILAGVSMYGHLSGVRRPESHADLISMVVSDGGGEIDTTGALKYSNFLLARGENISYLKELDSAVYFEKRAHVKYFSLERVMFKISNVIENSKDWNTFALAIRDIIPVFFKRLISRVAR